MCINNNKLNLFNTNYNPDYYTSYNNSCGYNSLSGSIFNRLGGACNYMGINTGGCTGMGSWGNLISMFTNCGNTGFLGNICSMFMNCNGTINTNSILGLVVGLAGSFFANFGIEKLITNNQDNTKEGSIEELKKNNEALNKEKTTLENEIKELEEQINSLKSQMSTRTTSGNSIGIEPDIQIRIANLQIELNNKSARLNEIKTTIKNNNAKIEKLQAKLPSQD